MNRRDFLKAAGTGAALTSARLAMAAEATKPKETQTVPEDIGKLDKEMAAKKAEGGLNWYDVQQWGVEGKAWQDTARYFDRLPARAQKMVRAPVWNLSRHSAGMCVRFETDATSISARWTLLSKSLAMTHMPATGVSGLDLYGQADDGQWRWVGVGRPDHGPNVSGGLVGGLPAKRRAYAVYLPLYNGVQSVEIGLPATAKLWPLAPRKDKPILFYGTSIMQGGCASRPGMAHSAMLGRRLDKPIVNLGFSGNGKMDLEIGELMAEIDACLYFVDCLPNMGAAEVAKRAVPFVQILRKARPDTPIALVEDRTYQNFYIVPAARRRNESRRKELRNAYKRLLSMGVEGLTYIEGDPLLGNDGEATVDSSHPTDLGFMRMANYLEPILRQIL